MFALLAFLYSDGGLPDQATDRGEEQEAKNAKNGRNHPASPIKANQRGFREDSTSLFLKDLRVHISENWGVDSF